MKKLGVKIITYFLVVGLIVLVPAISIDPYNVFHIMEPRDNGIESNKSFIKTEYIKKHHDEFDSLLFGSSRAGFVDIGYLNERTGAHFYNMASSECLVKEQTVELEEIIEAGFTPKRVWVMVDDISCFVDPALHENMLYRVPYPGRNIFDRAEFYLKYCDIITNINSLKVIREHSEKVAAELAQGVDNAYDASTGLGYLDRFYHTGTERLDKISQFNPDEPQYQEAYWCDYYRLRVDEALKDMQEMIDLCAKNNIELTVLVNPLYKLTYEKAVENGYLSYVEGLKQIARVHDFSEMSGVYDDFHYYYETSHFTPEVTRMMIDKVMLGR